MDGENESHKTEIERGYYERPLHHRAKADSHR